MSEKKKLDADKIDKVGVWYTALIFWLGTFFTLVVGFAIGLWYFEGKYTVVLISFGGAIVGAIVHLIVNKVNSQKTRKEIKEIEIQKSVE